MSMLTTDKVKAIAEELRITRYKSNGKIAFEYIYDKYKYLFEDRGGYDDFLYLRYVLCLARRRDEANNRNDTLCICLTNLKDNENNTTNGR